MSSRAIGSNSCGLTVSDALKLCHRVNLGSAYLVGGPWQGGDFDTQGYVDRAKGYIRSLCGRVERDHSVVIRTGLDIYRNIPDNTPLSAESADIYENFLRFLIGEQKLARFDAFIPDAARCGADKKDGFMITDSFFTAACWFPYDPPKAVKGREVSMDALPINHREIVVVFRGTKYVPYDHELMICSGNEIGNLTPDIRIIEERYRIPPQNWKNPGDYRRCFCFRTRPLPGESRGRVDAAYGLSDVFERRVDDYKKSLEHDEDDPLAGLLSIVGE